jgi:membrane protein DedA with SNARE-associated domain
MIYNFLEHYFNYYILFGWSILEGEVGLTLGGTFAKIGQMNFLYVVLTAVCGAYISDITVFFIGRYYKGHL